MEGNLKVIWAPWRLSYVSSVPEKQVSCFICNAINSSEDRKNLLLHRGDKAVVILNRFPYNTAHVMVCPIRHVGDFTGLNNDELLEINVLLKRVVEVIRKAYSPHGFNIGLNLGKPSGGSLDSHVHYHVVPRWLGDTNFMPVISGVKVIPQSLDDTYDVLKRFWESND
jgi:ATP adenylyltransferase